MIPGVDLNNKYVQGALGLGAAATIAGVAYLATGSKSSQVEEGCCGCGSSIHSMADDDHEVHEIHTEPVDVRAEGKTFLGSFSTLAKAVFLIPIVAVASLFKALFSGISSAFASIFGKDKVSI